MKKIVVIILTVSVIVGILLLVFRKSPTITNHPAQGKTIVAFGDSLVEGVGSTGRGDFPTLLSRAIGEPILNYGVAGNTTRDGLERIDEVNAEDPKIVLLLLGGNDFLRKIPVEETFKNLGEIIDRIQAEGAVVILLGVRGGFLSDSFEKHFENLAETKGTFYVSNVLAGLLTKPELMEDSIHPNNAGYQKIADRILPVLEKALGK